MTEVRPATCPRCGSIGHGERKCPFPKDFSLDTANAWLRVRTESCPYCETGGRMFRVIGSRNKTMALYCFECKGHIPPPN